MPVFLLRTADASREGRSSPCDFADLAACAAEAAAAQALDRLHSGDPAVITKAFVERPDGSVADHLGITMAMADLHRPDDPAWDEARAARAPQPLPID